MARYIDADELLKDLKKQYGEELGWQCTVNMSDVGMMIEDAPTADVVPRRILFDLERKLHSMFPFKAHSILTDDKYMANSYEMGQERVIYDILNFLAELEKNTRKENGDDNV